MFVIIHILILATAQLVRRRALTGGSRTIASRHHRDVTALCPTVGDRLLDNDPSGPLPPPTIPSAVSVPVLSVVIPRCRYRPQLTARITSVGHGMAAAASAVTGCLT